MKFIISASVLALIQNSGVKAYHHRHQAYGAARGSVRGHTKDIGMDNIDPWVYDMVSPEVEVTAWGRPAEAPSRKSYTPYSAAKPASAAAPAEDAPVEAAPVESLAQAYGAARGSARGHTKDIGMENIDPWVYDMVSPEVEVTAWGRPAEAPARKSYTPYSAVKPDSTAAPAEAAPADAAPAEAAAPAELLGLYQYGQYRPIYANPDGSMLVFTSSEEEPSAEIPAELAEPAAEGEAKEEKKVAEEAVVEGDVEAKKPDLSDPTRNNVVADGNSWTMKMSDGALERETPFPLKWAN